MHECGDAQQAQAPAIVVVAVSSRATRNRTHDRRYDSCLINNMCRGRKHPSLVETNSFVVPYVGGGSLSIDASEPTALEPSYSTTIGSFD